MDREKAKEYIQSRATDYLQRDRSGKGYVCPICQDGDGVHGHSGITTKDGVHFTCWRGCFQNADIIDIIGLESGLTDYPSKLQAAAKAFHVDLDSGRAENQKQDKSKRITQPALHNTQYTTQQPAEEPEPDYTDFILQAAKNIDKTDYHRGLSPQTLSRFHIGFVESWTHPKAPQAPASPRLIIPTSKHSYLARDTRAELTEEQKKYSKSKVGKVRIFNADALEQTSQPVFIVEGEIDAMSICEVGGEAVGIGSISYVKKLLALLEKKKPSQPLIISLDNEKAPDKQAKVEEAVAELAAGLDRLGISYYREDIAKPYKDANEALTTDRAALEAAINGAVERVRAAEAEALEAERDLLRREAVAYSLPDFIKDIKGSKEETFVSTGFSGLDKLLDGGLYAGLYIVGAISSLGKTTFCLQIADQIAQSGRDVLIFSLEMARNELIAKSISRLTLMGDVQFYETTKNAKTTRGILTGKRYDGYSEKEKELIQTAIEVYAEYARNIYITEGIGNVGVDAVREKVQKHIKLTGKPPVVIIDYLQILAPADIRATDKQNTDKAVLELKRLSRDYSIPVIGISSFNRDNYTAPVNLASFKESGAIEYSSDVLIGLQYDGMDYQEGEADKARDKRIRELVKEAVEAAKSGEAQKIQVKILKNRNGSKGETLLDFYPMFNYFTDKPLDIADDTTTGWSSSEGTYQTTAKPKKGKRGQSKSGEESGFTDITDTDTIPF